MLIDFGKLSKKEIIMLISVSLMMFARLFFRMTLNKVNHNLFLLPLINFLSKILNCILWLILYKKIKGLKDETKKNEDNLNDLKKKRKSTQEGLSQKEINELEINKKEKIKRIKKVLFVIIIGILDFISTFFNNILSQTNKHKNMGHLTLFSFSRFIGIYFFSYLFSIKKNIYKHQYISILIIIFTIIFLNIYAIIIFPHDNFDYFFYGGIILITETIYALLYVLGYKYLISLDGNVYKLLFYDGLISMVLLLVLQFFANYLSNIFQKFDNDKKYKNENIKVLSLFGEIREYISPNIFIYMIIQFAEVSLIWLLIFFYSVIRFAAVCSLPLFFEFLLEGVNSNENFINNFIDIILLILVELICFFMSLVCNEIIILRFFGLDENTKDNILKRERIDSNTSPTESLDEIPILPED